MYSVRCSVGYSPRFWISFDRNLLPSKLQFNWGNMLKSWASLDFPYVNPYLRGVLLLAFYRVFRMVLNKAIRYIGVLYKVFCRVSYRALWVFHKVLYKVPYRYRGKYSKR